MKKRFLMLTLIVAIGFNNQLTAQSFDWVWAKSAGGLNYDGSYSVTSDFFGNIIVTGFYGSTCSFDNIILSNVDYTDIFIAKYDASGNALWAKSGGGYDDEEAFSVTTDAWGNVIVVGYFSSDTINFDSTILVNSGLGDMFVVKYDSSGTLLWAKSAWCISGDEALSVIADASGNIIVTGFFIGSTITFDTITLTNSGEYDMFIVKYDPSGNVLWAKATGGSGSDYGRSITSDSFENIIVTGYFESSTITLDSAVLINEGNLDVFIVKYDASGNVLWAKAFGGSKDDRPYAVTNDDFGNIIVTGLFKSDSIVSGSAVLNNAGNGDIFIVKFDASGNELWAKSTGGNGSDRANSVNADALGNIMIAGLFKSDSIEFGSTSLNNAGNYDIFIAKYDAIGNELWAKSVGGNSSDIAYSSIFDVWDNLIVTGTFNSSLSFGNTNLTVSGIVDMFIAKLNGTTSLEELQNEEFFTITPNPFTDITSITFSKELKNAIINISDVSGKMIKAINFTGKQLNIDKGTMPAGLYFVKVITSSFMVTKKMIVIL